MHYRYAYTPGMSIDTTNLGGCFRQEEHVSLVTTQAEMPLRCRITSGRQHDKSCHLRREHPASTRRVR
jgi:hypothetical protein